MTWVDEAKKIAIEEDIKREDEFRQLIEQTIIDIEKVILKARGKDLEIRGPVFLRRSECYCSRNVDGSFWAIDKTHHEIGLDKKILEMVWYVTEPEKNERLTIRLGIKEGLNKSTQHVEFNQPTITANGVENLIKNWLLSLYSRKG